MIRRWGPALIALAFSATAASACPAGVAVVRVADGKVLFSSQAKEFELVYRHSVTLTPVISHYRLDATGIVQTEERFSAHGPGVASAGEGWHREGGQFVLPLERPIERLILRSAPQHENRLIVNDVAIDLFRWPREPLEVKPLLCGETSQ